MDAPYLRHGRRRKDVRSTTRSATSACPTNGEQLLVRQRRGSLHDRRRQGLRLEGRRREAQPLRPRLHRRPAEGMAPDLQRRLALVPRLLLRRQLPRPRLEGHGRQVPRLYPLPLVAGRAELGPVPDGRRALRLAHLHRRRRLRPGRDARLAGLHRPPRRRPRRRQGLRASTSWPRSTARPTSTSI